MKLNMTIDECLAFADEWSRGMTVHEGSQGWRVVCMLLAEEVRRLRGEGQGEFWASDTASEADTHQKDALRYRFLRTLALNPRLGLESFIALEQLDHIGDSAKIDAAIDAVMGCDSKRGDA